MRMRLVARPARRSRSSGEDVHSASGCSRTRKSNGSCSRSMSLLVRSNDRGSDQKAGAAARGEHVDRVDAADGARGSRRRSAGGARAEVGRRRVEQAAVRAPAGARSRRAPSRPTRRCGCGAAAGTACRAPGSCATKRGLVERLAGGAAGERVGDDAVGLEERPQHAVGVEGPDAAQQGLDRLAAGARARSSQSGSCSAISARSSLAEARRGRRRRTRT